jgi:hypothetical protein
MVFAAASHAEGHCAWLNDATASGVLNGPATLALESGADDQSVCAFTYQKTPLEYAALRILVQPMSDPGKAVSAHKSLCTSDPTPLKSIGNEAIACAADVGYSRGEQVIGRVRDRLFIVTVSSTAARDPMMMRAMLQDKAKLIAEQVAGALF